MVEILTDNCMKYKIPSAQRTKDLQDFYAAKKNEAPLYFYDTYRKVGQQVVDELVQSGEVNNRNTGWARLHRRVFPNLLHHCWNVAPCVVENDYIWPMMPPSDEPKEWTKAERCVMNKGHRYQFPEPKLSKHKSGEVIAQESIMETNKALAQTVSIISTNCN